MNADTSKNFSTTAEVGVTQSHCMGKPQMNVAKKTGIGMGSYHGGVQGHIMTLRLGKSHVSPSGKVFHSTGCPA